VLDAGRLGAQLSRAGARWKRGRVRRREEIGGGEGEERTVKIRLALEINPHQTPPESCVDAASWFVVQVQVRVQVAAS
jgi:hypothetical protein